MRYRSVLLLCLAAGFLGGAIGTIIDHVASSGNSSTLCYTFTRSYSQGLMDGFKGKICPSSPAVQAIAKNYNECVKQTTSAPQCGYALLTYLASSGAYPDDAAKAELLVLQAASGH